MSLAGHVAGGVGSHPENAYPILDGFGGTIMGCPNFIVVEEPPSPPFVSKTIWYYVSFHTAWQTTSSSRLNIISSETNASSMVPSMYHPRNSRPSCVSDGNSPISYP